MLRLVICGSHACYVRENKAPNSWLPFFLCIIHSDSDFLSKLSSKWQQRCITFSRVWLTCYNYILLFLRFKRKIALAVTHTRLFHWTLQTQRVTKKPYSIKLYTLFNVYSWFKVYFVEHQIPWGISWILFFIYLNKSIRSWLFSRFHIYVGTHFSLTHEAPYPSRDSSHRLRNFSRLMSHFRPAIKSAAWLLDCLEKEGHFQNCFLKASAVLRP